MKMTERRRHAAILSIPVLVFLGCGIALLYEYRGDRTGRGNLIVGTLQEETGDVRRRPPDRFRWFLFGDLNEVFAKDSVRTAQASRALIDLDVGGQIDIGENTLVYIDH